MIVHNRGWGPQIEDALFVDQITGQYRFTGAPQLMPAAARVAAGSAPAARKSAPQAIAGRGDSAIAGSAASKIR